MMMFPLRTFSNEFRRSMSLWKAYQLDTISWMILWIIVFPLIIIMFDSISGGYDVSNRIDSLIGFLVWDLCMGVLTMTTTSIAEETQDGTLENILISPITPTMLFSIRISVSFIRQAIQTLIVGIAIIIILRLPLLELNFWSIVIIFLTVLGVGGVSLIFGGLALVYKNVSSAVNVISLLALFFTGAIISLDSLGILFDALKFLLPTAWGIDALRQSVVLGFVDETVILGLSIQAVLLVFAGAISFQWGFKRAQRQGSLGTY